jgi:hypothetical protein
MIDEFILSIFGYKKIFEEELLDLVTFQEDKGGQGGVRSL